MSKRKRKRKNRKTTNIPPATTLRLRLGNLWADTALLQKDDEAIEKDLDAVARNIAPDILVKTLLRVYPSTSASARARLDSVLPHWLKQRGHIDVLKEMTVDLSLDTSLRPTALAWMASLGIDTESLENPPSLFFDAYYYDDKASLGEKSQAYVMVLWYHDTKKRRAQGMGFLLDYNPPWEGSIKDILTTPRRAPKRLLRDILDTWKQGGMEPWPISAEQAKTVILTALNCNRAAGIRLPRDLISARETFDRYLMSLPDAPDTPLLMIEDFDLLARQGKRPEEIMHFEQTVGRRVRMEDGNEILVMGSPDWDDKEW
jgi:hypothetical protein